MRIAIRIMGFLAAGMVMCAASARAQDFPTGGPPVSGGETQEAPDETQTGASDSYPVLGTENSIGDRLLSRRSFLLPSLSVSVRADSNRSGFSDTSWDSVQSQAFLMGRLGLLRKSRHAELTLDYLGGGSVSVYQSTREGGIHSLRLAETVRGRRWSLLVGGQASYLPTSSFGLGNAGGLDAYGVGGSGGFGGTGSGFHSDLQPSQSISSQDAQRLSATGIVQTSFHLGGRSSLTFFGSYGILQFLDPVYFDSNQIIAQGGYEKQVSRKDTLAVLFRFADFRFPGQGREIGNYVANLAYARRINGRLNWQISGGPQYLQISPAEALRRQMSWRLASALDYKAQRFSLRFSYHHAITGGSGMLQGAETDQVQATFSRQLSPRWRGSLGAGFADNQGITRAAASSINGSLQHWYGSARLNRRVGEKSNFFLAYNARLQGANTPGCLGSVCATTSIDHQVTVGFNVALRPLVVE